jgi:hypothetical protein
MNNVYDNHCWLEAKVTVQYVTVLVIENLLISVNHFIAWINLEHEAANILVAILLTVFNFILIIVLWPLCEWFTFKCTWGWPLRRKHIVIQHSIILILLSCVLTNECKIKSSVPRARMHGVPHKRLRCFAHKVQTGAGIAQSVYCLTTDSRTGVQCSAEAKDFSSSVCVQTGSGAHPESCTMGTWGPFPGVKRGRVETLTTPSSAEVKND